MMQLRRGLIRAGTARRFLAPVLLCLSLLVNVATAAIATAAIATAAVTTAAIAADRATTPATPAPADRDTTSPGQIEQLLNRYFEASDGSLESANLHAADQPYLRYEGRTIRHIHIKLLGLTSGLPRKVANRSLSGLSKWIEGCHFDTKADVVRNYLLISEGDCVDPQTIADSERLLRETGLFQLVHIMTVPVSRKSRQVDLIVFARDLWTLGANLRLGLLPDVAAQVYERNLWGYGHNVEIRTKHLPGDGHVEEVAGTYRLPNIYGSFVLGETGWSYKRGARKNRYIDISRSPVAPMIRLTGALRLENEQQMSAPDSSGASKNSRYDSYNGWIGYSIPLERTKMGRPGGMKFFPALRLHWVDYLERPAVQSDRWTFDYQDRVLLLGSLQLSSSQYLKGQKIYGYGPTEDIPVGFLIALNGGQIFGSRTNYQYAGGKVAGGVQLGGAGVASGMLEWGSFRHNGSWFDTVFRAQTRWFSELSELSAFQLRHFLDLSFTSGNNILGPDRVMLDETNGLRGIESSEMGGAVLCALNWESVAFTPWKLLGFQIAGYLFSDLAVVGKDVSALQSARYYSSHGIGIRIKNRSLIFDAVDLRFAFFPSLPEGADQEWVHVGSLKKLDSSKISVESPLLIEYP